MCLRVWSTIIDVTRVPHTLLDTPGHSQGISKTLMGKREITGALRATQSQPRRTHKTIDIENVPELPRIGALRTLAQHPEIPTPCEGIHDKLGLGRANLKYRCQLRFRARLSWWIMHYHCSVTKKSCIVQDLSTVHRVIGCLQVASSTEIWGKSEEVRKHILEY